MILCLIFAFDAYDSLTLGNAITLIKSAFSKNQNNYYYVLIINNQNSYYYVLIIQLSQN